MFLTMTESARLDDVADELRDMYRTDWYDELRVPANANAATDCLRAMDGKRHIAETITEDVARFYWAMGFAVRINGIGWLIAPSERIMRKAAA